MSACSFKRLRINAIVYYRRVQLLRSQRVFLSDTLLLFHPFNDSVKVWKTSGVCDIPGWTCRYFFAGMAKMEVER